MYKKPIFNCERSSSTIYKINLWVCQWVKWQSWKLSLKVSLANQSTVSD